MRPEHIDASEIDDYMFMDDEDIKNMPRHRQKTAADEKFEQFENLVGGMFVCFVGIFIVAPIALGMLMIVGRIASMGVGAYDALYRWLGLF